MFFQRTYLLLLTVVEEMQGRYSDSIVQPRKCVFWPGHGTRNVSTFRRPGIT